MNIFKLKNKNQLLSRNPFNIGACARGDGFFNRENELNQINAFIRTPHEYHLIITGQRRIGKTSLLRYIQDSITDQIHPVYYDLQDKARLPFPELLYGIAKKIRLELGINFDYTREDFKDPLFFINSFLKATTGSFQKDEILLLLFDEFDVLGNLSDIEDDPFIDNLSYNRFVPFINQWKNGIRDLHLPIKLIFAAGRSFKDLNQERYGTFFKYARQVILSHFTKKKVSAFIHELSKDVLRFEESALEELFNVATGHPYFTQALASEAYKLAVFNNQHKVKSKNILDSFKVAIKSVAGGIYWLWDGFSVPQKILLYVIARIEEEKKHFTRKNIEQTGEDLQLSPGLDNLVEAINQLINVKVLKPVRENELCTGIMIPFFQKWIVQELVLHDITKLLNELDEELPLDL